ncbi:MAG: DNA cytosine methyltransferase [Abditibacteriota bacterium]|nr:DNA cytosine methyltransferase [Abditibacteriota bacterium]
MLRLLLGGSPCQWWSQAKTIGRETEPTGIGWELFRNYLFARQKYQPDFFLYENNKSMAKAVREQITAELGVEPIYINSALVSAQNRQRLYWTNIPGVVQPEDRGILFRDILESGEVWLDKSYCLTATQYKGVSLEHHLTHHVRILVAEPVPWNTTDTRGKPVRQIRDGQVEIRGKRLSIPLPDGLYTMRSPSALECMRLQTVPEDYRFPVSRSRALALLGNGWTVQIISHILSYCPGIRTEPLEVLSMYDGMSCGRLALRELNTDVIRYCATEIDPYAIRTTQANFPDTIQLGDAFQVREDNWKIQN